jgi:hypothetical protein
MPKRKQASPYFTLVKAGDFVCAVTSFSFLFYVLNNLTQVLINLNY